MLSFMQRLILKSVDEGDFVRNRLTLFEQDLLWIELLKIVSVDLEISSRLFLYN